MKLREYMQKNNFTMKDKVLFAKRCQSSQRYLYLVELGHKRPSPALALVIEKETDGHVSRYDSRPDIYPRYDIKPAN